MDTNDRVACLLANPLMKEASSTLRRELLRGHSRTSLQLHVTIGRHRLLATVTA